MALQGTLDTFELPDVLRLLASTKKSGRLTLRSDRGEGDVWLAGGRIVDVTTGAGAGASRADGLFELLRAHEGSFAFDPGAESSNPSNPSEPGDVEPLLAEAEEALTEWRTIEAVVPSMTRAEVRTLLAKFGLKADQVTSIVGRLSPGERTRAAMALLQARGVNLLVLDEPTNHLDLPAIEQLESALDSYEGTLLLVTHDRRMLDAVRVTRRLEVADGKVTER